MIPIKNMEWHGYWNGVDLRMTIDLQLWSKRLGTLKEMRRENRPCLLKSYFTYYNAWSCCWRSPFLLSPLPSAGGGGARGGGRENESISPAVALLSQYSNIGKFLWVHDFYSYHHLHNYIISVSICRRICSLIWRISNRQKNCGQSCFITQISWKQKLPENKERTIKKFHIQKKIEDKVTLTRNQGYTNGRLHSPRR